MADLIAGLGEGRSKLGAARKVLERLEKKAAPVAAPLPGPIRARQERRAGYEEARKEVTKWLPIVKANREAPTLRFTADRSAVPKVGGWPRGAGQPAEGEVAGRALGCRRACRRGGIQWQCRAVWCPPPPLLLCTYPMERWWCGPRPWLRCPS